MIDDDDFEDFDLDDLEDDDQTPIVLEEEPEEEIVDKSGLFLPIEDEDEEVSVPETEVETAVEDEDPAPEETETSGVAELPESVDETPQATVEAPTRRRRRSRAEIEAEESKETVTTDTEESHRLSESLNSLPEEDARYYAEHTEEPNTGYKMGHKEPYTAFSKFETHDFNEYISDMLSSGRISKNDSSAIYYLLGKQEATREFVTTLVVSIGGSVKALLESSK